MSIILRGNKFHYRFRLNGEDFSGPCPGCEVEKGLNGRALEAVRARALREEAKARACVTQKIEERKKIEEEVRRNKSVRALVENYKYELTGGSPITLSEAFPLAAAKPSKRESRSSYAALRETYWEDFAAFMRSEFQEVQNLASVRRAHCEAYVSYLVAHGRFIKKIQYQTQGKRDKLRDISYEKDYGLSPKTIKEIVGVCRWVFSRLEEDAGLFHNPWDRVVLPLRKPVAREVFSPHELRLIWNGIQNDPFCYPLFVVAANSGMTEGDICTLKWGDIDWASGCIRRLRRKTGTEIKLPLLPELAEYLGAQPRRGEFIFPAHAEMYLRQPTCVSERVKKFLNGLGIVTTVSVPGRRAVSVKDLHSMRHVFCYRAKRAGIPESVIKRFVGHAVLAMTEHYADHDTDEELRAEIKKLRPLFVGDAGAGEPESFSRRKLAELAYSLPLKTVEELIARCSKMLTA